MQTLRMVIISAKMHHRDQFFNKSIYLSMTLWPTLMFISTDYSDKPFSRSAIFQRIGLAGEDEIFVFLLLGFMGMVSFHVLIQSAWRGASSMRYSGTLEVMYLTPVNRMTVLVGNCIGSLFGSVWMISIFYGGILIIYWDIVGPNFVGLLFGLILLMLTALCWGVFLNSLFLFSRDSGFLYTVFQTPVSMFTGAKIPFDLMPLWARALGHMIPLTYVITLLRELVLGSADIKVMWKSLIMAIVVCAFLLIAAYIIMIKAEKNAGINGSATLF